MHSALISLKDRQIQQLLKLQQLFHSHYLTEQLLNQMISLYVKFVEHIQHNQHPLRLYFMQKIRFVLSRPEVNKILEKQSLSERSIRDTVREIMGKNEEEDLEIKRLAEEAREEVRNNHIINLKKQRPPQQPSQLREQQRSIKIAMQMKIMQQVQQNIQKLRNDFSKNTQKSKQKTKEIDKIVNNQDQRLAQRRANRKKKLRKKSADLNEKEVQIVEAPPPLNRQELKLVHMIVHQTFQRFTRLTQNKAMQEANQKPNQGRVKIQLEQKEYKDEEEDIFEPKKQEPSEPPKLNFSKKKSIAVQQSPTSKKQQEKPIVPTRETTVIQYKTFEQNKGRVTVRNNQYEQIEDDDI